MSGSPKYSLARLRAAQERLLRHARAQAANLERARRAEEENRRRAERLDLARQSANQDGATLRKKVAEFVASDAGRRVYQEINDLQNRLLALQASLATADNVKELQRLARASRSLEDELAQIVAVGQAANRAAGLAELQAERMALEQRLAAEDRGRADLFDPGAVQEVERLLKEVATAFDRQAGAKAQHFLNLARERLERHQYVVQTGYVQLSAQRDQCRAVLAEASDRVAGLRADDIILRWGAGDVQSLEKQLEQIKAQIESGQLVEMQKSIDTILNHAEEVVTRAQETQLAEDRRNYIVNGIMQVMKKMGFVVQAGSPSLEDPRTPASAAIIQARRIGGGAIAVSVPQHGEVWYDVAGFPMRQETGSDAQLVSTCDEAELQIEKMHEIMEDVFGVEMTELQWQGKDPGRTRKQADSLPGSRGGTQHQGGSI